jgi:hypothetical protein
MIYRTILTPFTTSEIELYRKLIYLLDKVYSYLIVVLIYDI